jgi:hypothetical protein
MTLYGQGLKYPALSESRVITVGDSGKWDANKVHTLSVVESTIRKSFVSNECIA